MNRQQIKSVYGVDGSAKISRQEAKQRLTARWHEQSARYPTMHNDIPLQRYIKVNAPIVMALGCLQEYARKGAL